MADLHIENVGKSYGAVEVLSDIRLEIKDGEFVVLVGPSGCGKSTLLRMIAGLEDITAGQVSIDNIVVNDLPPKARDIAMVFQNYALYPQMTVAQNMGFSLEMQRVPKPEIEKKVAEVAKILDLNALLGRKPAQLSGGQRQRVAMGRAIVRSPKVFLFDEPLSNLDAKLRVQMRAEIKSLHERLGSTAIYVTHDQVEAMTMADKIVVMNGGNIEQIGAPLELYDNPRNTFVAGFLGSPSMNFLEGTVKDNKLIMKDGSTIDVATNGTDGAKLTIGGRPEKIQIDPSSNTKGTIRLVEPTGSETIVTASLGEKTISILSSERIVAKSGDEIGIRIDANDIHLFEQASGIALRNS